MRVTGRANRSGGKQAPASSRRRGAQPRNLNALKHGFYARHLSDGEAADLQEAAAQTLNGEIGLTRVAARRMLELFEAEATLEGKIVLANVISTAAVRVASLLKTKKYLNGNGDSPGAPRRVYLKNPKRYQLDEVSSSDRSGPKMEIVLLDPLLIEK